MCNLPCEPFITRLISIGSEPFVETWWQQSFQGRMPFSLFNFSWWEKINLVFIKPGCCLFCHTPDKLYKQTRWFPLTHEINSISRLSIKWAKIPTPKLRESFLFVYPPKTWETHVSLPPWGECKELQPYSGGQKPCQSWRKFECHYDWNRTQKPGTFLLLQSRTYTPIDELSPCDLRICSGDKKRPQWFHALLFVIECMSNFCGAVFRDLVFVISFFVVSLLRVSRRSEYMSARRIAYAWFICLLLFLACCVSTLRFLSPFSQTLLCSSTVHWPQK